MFQSEKTNIYEILTNENSKKSLADEFVHNCEIGNLSAVCETFEKNTYRENKKLISYQSYLAFQYACEEGHLDIAKLIVSNINDCHHEKLFKVNDYYAYRHACAKGHLNVVVWILEIYKKIELNSLSGFAYINAIKNEHWDIVEYLCIYMSGKKEYSLELTRPTGCLENMIQRALSSAPINIKYSLVKALYLNEPQSGYESYYTAKRNVKNIFIYSFVNSRDIHLKFIQYMYDLTIQTNAFELNENFYDRLFRLFAYYNAGFAVSPGCFSKVMWLMDKLPKKYFAEAVSVNNGTNCFPYMYICDFASRKNIPDYLLKEQHTLCSSCKTHMSDWIYECGHQFCTKCIHNYHRLHNSARIYFKCKECNEIIYQCFPSTYDYLEIQHNFEPLKLDLIQMQFQPNNVHKFEGWQINWV